LTKPRLSLLVIITMGGAILMAPGHVGAVRGVIAVLATAMVVGAANALNCYLERELDRFMERTRTRPLPAQRLDPRWALILATVLLLPAVPALFVAVNALTGLLALTALATYVLLYTPMKQRSALALWVGAVPGAIPPLMGWTAVRDRIEWPGVALFAILFCWQIPHFIAIGTHRAEDYQRAGHRILPLVVGETAVNLHAVVWTALLVPATLVLCPLGLEGVGYFVVATVLGLGFLGWTLTGFKARNAEARRLWSRGLFRASLLYLTALFVGLSVFAR
jgi:protoheme IX farnesyltransferase